MSDQQNRTHILERLGALLQEKLPSVDVASVQRFVSQYYAAVVAEDLLDRSLEDLFGAALCQWRHMTQRDPGDGLIRVYNPDYEEDGWQSTHTVVEVVTDDMPFLVDSLSMELVRGGIGIHLVLHPVIHAMRDTEGHLHEILPAGEHREDAIAEAVLRFEVDRQSDPAVLAGLQTSLAQVLADVRAVVEDWATMREKINNIIATIEQQSLPVAKDDKQEALAFLRWLENHHYTFIGFRAYDLVEEQGEDILRQIPGSGLGILRDAETARASQSFAHIPPPLRALARAPTLLIITKSTAVSTVHRPVHLDYLGIKRFNDSGEVVGEWRFLGLYSSLAYSARAVDIPILRKKVRHVIDKTGYAPASHGRKALQHVLDTFPRDEMFQFTEDELYDVATGILQVQERHRLGLFLRRDLFNRFTTALVYVPRDRYDTDLRRRIQEILMQALDGQSVEFNIQISETPLARVHFIIRTRPDYEPDYDATALHARMTEAMLSWEDELQNALHEHLGEAHGTQLFHRYGNAFPPAYRDDYSPRTAVADIQRLEKISDLDPLTVHLYRPPEGDEELLRFKIYGRNRLIALSDALPMLERMGLRVLSARPYEIEPRSGSATWILDFDLTAGRGINIEVLEIKNLFQEAFAQVCSGAVENDGFNRLVLAAGLQWRQVVMLRALCKYLLQTRTPFSQAYIEQTLADNAVITKRLVELFESRFDISRHAHAARHNTTLLADIESQLEAVGNLDEDRILRHFLSLIRATKGYLSFKFDPSQVPTLPLPRPMYEIFVYSPRAEGVHLRGGPVARGGIRWSDRREDFRTEVLGLMKAQMVKNAVIVPVGAKGGFVCKRLPATDDRDVIQDEVVHCYRTFISGLLDLTDNLVNGVVAPPEDTVRHDGDDTYLVVAADKGTATFSDIANRLAADYGFWLGDAFASGGSSGYDHKKMGITARGAWESVKRHFRELDIDIQRQPVSVVGIGDMAGDVFGNGMLLSEQIKLIAAFNHMHIFIDPSPDPGVSFQERQRLFILPRSSWSDYNAELISRGGGVYSRRAKSIALSDEMRIVLGTEASRVTPAELIQIILRAPVDLLWNGGIGTYVKATNETHSDVGDRANDALRVDALELRCRVVGEGGNLGFTQLARVEYARVGGLINSDFIDNSGGVDCSDHEVNIKILLNQVVSGGDLTVKQRNRLLVDMTDEVAALVLADNYLQTQALSVATQHASFLLSDHARLIRTLEKEGRLRRKLEFLPSDEEIAERETAQQGLSRPEIAVLLAYSKIKFYEELLDSDISDDPYLSHELGSYFPAAMQESYAPRMLDHPLRRQIIATQITNDMVNRMGGTFWFRAQDTTGDAPAAIARAYTAAREIFKICELWRGIEAVDNQVSSDVQLTMITETRRLLDRATLWLLRHSRQPLDIAATIAHYAPSVQAVAERLPRLLKDEERASVRAMAREFSSAGTPKQLALRVAALDSLHAALDLTQIARDTDSEILLATDVYFSLSAALELNWLRERIHALPRRDPWQRKARTGLLTELHGEMRALAQHALISTRHIKGTAKRIEAWLNQHTAAVAHCQSLFAEIHASGKADLAMLTVALREVHALARVREASGQEP